MKRLIALLVFLPTVAVAQPLILPETKQPTAAYDAQGRRYDVFPSPLGETVYGPNGERLDVIQKPDSGSVIYDQHGARVFESYPSTLDPAPLEQR